MYVNDKIITEKVVANCFATYFEGKVDKIVKNANILFNHTTMAGSLSKI